MSELGGAFDPTGRRYWRQRTSRAVLIFGVITLIGVVLIRIERASLLDTIGRKWIVSDQLEPADAAAVLGGGRETRPYAAAQLYKAGCVRRIVVSNAGVGRFGADNPDRDELLKLGVPATAIATFGLDPKNTFQEARALAHWAKNNHAHRIIVPVEIFASRRFKWILSRELKKAGAHVMIEALAPPAYDLNNWWQQVYGIDDFESEIVKYVYYRLAYRRS